MKISRTKTESLVFDDDGNVFRREAAYGPVWMKDYLQNYVRWVWVTSARGAKVNGHNVGKARFKKLEAEFQALTTQP